MSIMYSIFKRLDFFQRAQHNLQCKRLLGEEFDHVHRAMDGNGGFYHRRNGHSRDFLSKLKSNKERQACCIHLLGDCILDKFHEALEPVLNKICEGKIEPPFYHDSQSGSNWFWDIQEEALDNMMKEWGEIYAETLGKRIDG